MKPVLFLLGILFMLSSNAQETYEIVEKQPEFPGGLAAMQEYLATNIIYPIEAIESGIQGVVYIKFLLTKSGEIEQLKIVRGVDDLLDNEAKRVILLMPKWVPGEQAGGKVNVWLTVPVRFKLY